MRFFKHFTDAHRGKSLQTLRRDHGLKLVGFYWTLVEICAEKMNKEKDEEYTETHCIFQFDRRYLAQTSGAHQVRTLEIWLRCLGDVALISWTCDGDTIEISMPKLLECLDRDSKRARPVRGKVAASARQEIEEEIEKEVDSYVPPAEVTEDISVDNSDKPHKQSKPKTLEITTAPEFNEHCAEFKDDWRRDFPDTEFLKTEILKAIDWLAKKKGTKKARRTKRGWQQFFTNWFKTAWDQKASAPAHGPSADAWTEQAVKVKTALNRWGDWSGRHAAEVKEFLGEGLYWLAIKASTRELRNLPANDFYIRSVIGKLKEAQQKMEQQGSPR